MYKIAKDKSKKLKDQATKAMVSYHIAKKVPFAATGVGASYGYSKGHLNVGTLLGVPAVNGAIARDEGVSLLPQTMGVSAVNGAIMTPLIMLPFTRNKKNLALGSIVGATINAAGSGIRYGLGYAMSKKKKQKKS